MLILWPSMRSSTTIKERFRVSGVSFKASVFRFQERTECKANFNARWIQAGAEARSTFGVLLSVV